MAFLVWNLSLTLDGADMPTFTWPLLETSPMRVSTTIPPDLLD
jgi:hypothetical protein